MAHGVKSQLTLVTVKFISQQDTIFKTGYGYFAAYVQPIKSSVYNNCQTIQKIQTLIKILHRSRGLTTLDEPNYLDFHAQKQENFVQITNQRNLRKQSTPGA